MDEVNRVVFEPVVITQEYRYFDYISPWGASEIIQDLTSVKNFTMNFWPATSSGTWCLKTCFRVKWRGSRKS